MTRTRLAPSPTGYLHIGGVRSALFCWLFARKHQGQFILRIDDTDAQRNVEEALAPILHGFRWLGLNWDEGPEVGGPHEPYYQSQRLERYQQAVQQLLDKGLAYRDYATTDEVKVEREAAEKEKRQFVYSRQWMADTPEKQAAFEAEGRQGVVRLLMPREGKLVLNDLIRGQVEFDWSREQDHVIQRADGTCLYHLANVVDDFDFQITHVIRAEEHLSNTARQVFIVDGLGYPRPAYAHLPFVAEPGSKTKLSKRKIPQYLKNKGFAGIYEHGCQIARALKLTISEDTFNPVIVDFYEQVGYLPQAILNYLLLVGWSLDDKTEYFTLPEMIEHFSLERVIKAPASFDPDKLLAFQSHYMNLLGTEEKLALTLPFLLKAGMISDPEDFDVRKKVARIIIACCDRLKVSGDILLQADFFFTPDEQLEYSPKDFEKRVKSPGACERLQKIREHLAPLDDFSVPSLEQSIHQFVESQGLKIGDIVHVLRVSTTGRSVGPGLYDCLSILGRPSVLARMDRALELAQK